MRLMLAVVATHWVPALCVSAFCPASSPPQLWVRIILSPLCLRFYRTPPRPPSFSQALFQAARKSLIRIASNALSHYIAFFDFSLTWTWQLLTTFASRLSTPTFGIAFALGVGAEIARRRWNGPNVVAAIERFIDDHIRLQRYAIHQILMISWLLTGGWADVYTWLRDIFFRHVSDVSWALLLARGCMRLIDAIADAAAHRNLLAALRGPTARKCLSFATWKLTLACLALSICREAALFVLRRDPEVDPAGVFELSLDVFTVPLARACGTSIALAAIAELGAALACVLCWCEVVRLLKALGRYNIAIEIKENCLARKRELCSAGLRIRATGVSSLRAHHALCEPEMTAHNSSHPIASTATSGSVSQGDGEAEQLRPVTLRAAIAEQRADIAAARELAAALLVAEREHHDHRELPPVAVAADAGPDLVGELAAALTVIEQQTTNAEQRAAAFITDLDGCIRQAASVEESALAQVNGPALPFWYAVIRPEP
jgi:hypothetical protein